MDAKVFIDGHPTSLKVFAGVITTYLPPLNQLVCANVVVLAENPTNASTLIAMELPHYELQALTCISDVVWFEAVHLDNDHPTVQLLRSFVISHVEEIVDNLLDRLGTP